MEERGQGLHDEENACGRGEPEVESDNDGDQAARLKGRDENPLPKHGRQLAVCKSERPEAQVGRSVAHRSEHELNRVDELVDDNIRYVEGRIHCSMVSGVVSVLAMNGETLPPTCHVSLVQEIRLGHEHDRNARQGHQNEKHLYGALKGDERNVDLTRREEHVNENLEEVSRLCAQSSPIRGPFYHDDQGEISEDGREKHHLRNKVVQHVQGFLEVEGIEEGDENSIHHVQHAKNYGKLHLHRVEKLNVRERPVPNGIAAECVAVA